MRVRLVLAVGAALAALATGSAHATGIVNGSFENTTGFVDNTGQDTDNLAPGSTAITGWTVGAAHNVAWLGPSNPFGVSASNGSYFLDLTSYNDGAPYGSVSQTLSTLIGATYQVTFDLGSSSSYGIPDGLTVSAGNASQTFVSTLSGSNNWESETFTFQATGASTVLDFQGASGNAYIGLDNVAISGGAVPEPQTWAMLMLGLFGLGAALRSRVKALPAAAA